MKYLTSFVLVSCLLVVLITSAGCISPRIGMSTPGVAGSATHEPGSSAQTDSPVGKVESFQQAAQREVNWQAGMLTIAGLLMLALSGFLAYTGKYAGSIKLAIAGVILPILGLWFAYNWMLLIIVVLVTLVVVVILSHYSIIAPMMSRLESRIMSQMQSLTSRSDTSSGPSVSSSPSSSRPS